MYEKVVFFVCAAANGKVQGAGRVILLKRYYLAIYLYIFIYFLAYFLLLQT